MAIALRMAMEYIKSPDFEKDRQYCELKNHMGEKIGIMEGKKYCHNCFGEVKNENPKGFNEGDNVMYAIDFDELIIHKIDDDAQLETLNYDGYFLLAARVPGTKKFLRVFLTEGEAKACLKSYAESELEQTKADLQYHKNKLDHFIEKEKRLKTILGEM